MAVRTHACMRASVHAPSLSLAFKKGQEKGRERERERERERRNSAFLLGPAANIYFSGYIAPAATSYLPLHYYYTM